MMSRSMAGRDCDKSERLEGEEMMEMVMMTKGYVNEEEETAATDEEDDKMMWQQRGWDALN